MLYNAVIFDLDGTLTDSKEGILACTRYALEKMNWPIPDDATLQKFLGPPLVDSFMRWCGMTEEQGRVGLDYYREKYQPGGWKMNAVYPGIRELLKELKKRGVYVAVATGKPQKNSERIVEYYGLAPFIDALAGPDENETHADKKDLILRVLPKGKKAVMVGDTAGDVKGGIDAGIDTMAALWGYGNHADMAALHPTHTAKDPAEAAEILCPGAEKKKGVFLTFEGVDGCGKTTQMRLCAERLISMGYSVVTTREPGGCPLSEQIRGMLLSKEDNGMCAETEALLFAASRAQHIHDVILPAVEAGKIVLCDRFIDSSMVYQGAARGLGYDWVRLINRAARETCAPHRTLYLKMNHDEALRRRGAASQLDRIERAGDAFFSETEKAYDRLCAEEPGRILSVDGNGTVEEVQQRVFAAVMNEIDRQ